MFSKVKNTTKVVVSLLVIVFVLVSCGGSGVATSVQKPVDILDSKPSLVMIESKIGEIKLGKEEKKLEVRRKEIKAEKEKLELERREKEREERRIRTREIISRGRVMNVPSQSKSNHYMKSWMDWTASSNKKSAQYKFQNNGKVYTDKDGMRRCSHDLEDFPDAYVGAIGQRFADNIGDLLIIKLANGYEFPFIVGEFKANRHVDANGQHLKDKSIIEFTVAKNQISSKVRKMGNVSFLVIDNQNLMLSPIVSITKIDI